jgi:hypothetical protein
MLLPKEILNRDLILFSTASKHVYLLYTVKFLFKASSGASEFEH